MKEGEEGFWLLFEGGVRGMSVAIQWQIWLHLGFWREGASGSVRARVSWIEVLRGWRGVSSVVEMDGTVSMK